jgi:hypothetical protein
VALVYRNGRPRLQRSVRRNGVVTSEYRGSGETALLIAAMERIEREQRYAQHMREEAEQQESDKLDQALDEVVKQARAIARDALVEAGCYQHHRQWRKRRVERQA